MRMSRFIARMSFMLAPALSASAQDAAEETALERGKAVYDQWCIICHGEDDPASGGGTAALEFLYQGALPAKLEDRSDMTPELITELVRRGRFGMPNFRLTEISEQQLEDMIAYLRRNSGDAGDANDSGD